MSTARHDFFGVAISEAIASGARPVLPKRLAYPELVPTELHPELLYEGSLEDARSPPADLVHAFFVEVVNMLPVSSMYSSFSTEAGSAERIEEKIKEKTIH